MSQLPSDAVEVDSDEPPDYQRADGTPGYLLRVYTTPTPPLVFTVQTKGSVTAEAENEKAPPLMSPAEWLRASGFFSETKRIPSLEERAKTLYRFWKVYQVSREYRSRMEKETN